MMKLKSVTHTHLFTKCPSPERLIVLELLSQPKTKLQLANLLAPLINIKAWTLQSTHQPAFKTSIMMTKIGLSIHN